MASPDGGSYPVAALGMTAMTANSPMSHIPGDAPCNFVSTVCTEQSKARALLLEQLPSAAAPSPLLSCYPKCDPWISSIGITWELVRKAGSWTVPQTY